MKLIIGFIVLLVTSIVAYYTIVTYFILSVLTVYLMR